MTLEVAGTDQFGRTLAHVFTGTGLHVNLDLVDTGMAIATTPEDGETYGSSLLAAEDSAWGQRLGLWEQDACGASNTLPEVVIGSLRFDPPGPDDEVPEDETVTIINMGSRAVNLTGWVLRDESSRHRYSFSNGQKLEGGATMIVTSADAGWDPGGSPVWNNDGDLVILLDNHGRVVDRWRY